MEEGLRKTGLVNKQERIWNLDERGFSFETMIQKVVSHKGAVTIYQQTKAEKSETSTVLPSMLLEFQVFPLRYSSEYDYQMKFENQHLHRQTSISHL